MEEPDDEGLDDVDDHVLVDDVEVYCRLWLVWWGVPLGDAEVEVADDCIEPDTDELFELLYVTLWLG